MRRLAWLLIAFFSIALCAQVTTPGLSGKITGPLGNAVAGATVTLKNSDTGQTVTAQTDSNGAYTVSVPAGQYQASVTAIGFAGGTANVAIVAGAGATLNLVLQAAAAPALSLGDLGFPTSATQANPEEQARLNRRSHMLQIHQRLGLITIAPLAATFITGPFAGGRATSTGMRNLHAGLGIATTALYFTAASYAIRAPRISGVPTRGPIRLHEAMAWIHVPGMILTPILGAMAYEQRSRGERVHGIARLHGPVAIATGAAFGVAVMSVTMKF